MIPFEGASYLTQVSRLRDMADRALQRYPIRRATCSLINHWENTTFQVRSKSGDRYVLRIHRPGYHSEAAIREELRWLARLSAETSLRVPIPVPSTTGRLLERVASPYVPQERYCCLLRWIDGRFIRKNPHPAHNRELGRVIAGLHKKAKGVQVIHRRYWDAEGLVGTNPQFGSIDRLGNVTTKVQDLLTAGRLLVLRRLKRFERDCPQKQSLIHADLHFDNVLVVEGDFAVIDFDDCGFGFHAYDLEVNLVSILGDLRAGKEYLRMKDALIEGYAMEWGWSKSDEEILPLLMTARRFVMLGWLNSRTDHPRLRKRIPGAASLLVKHLRMEYGL